MRTAGFALIAATALLISISVGVAGAQDAADDPNRTISRLDNSRMVIGEIKGSPELAVPLEIPVRVTGRVRKFLVSQTQGTRYATPDSETAGSVSRSEGDTYYLRVIPMRLGEIEISVMCVFEDRVASIERFMITVGLSPIPPAAFEAKSRGLFQVRTGTASMGLDLGLGSKQMLTPRAKYDSVAQWVELEPSVVKFALVGGADDAVVNIDDNGVVHALRPGSATILVTFMGLTDTVQVRVFDHK